jgi:hypothetical protein
MRGGFALIPRGNKATVGPKAPSAGKHATLTHCYWHVSVLGMWAIFSIVLFYFAGAFSALGMLPELCTQGGAEGPFFVVISGPLYALAFGMWSLSKFNATVLKACAPLAIVIVLQLEYAFRFSAVVFRGVSACEALTGMRYNTYIGNEVLYGIAWLTMALAVPFLTVLIVWRSRPLT